LEHLSVVDVILYKRHAILDKSLEAMLGSLKGIASDALGLLHHKLSILIGTNQRSGTIVTKLCIGGSSDRTIALGIGAPASENGVGATLLAEILIKRPGKWLPALMVRTKAAAATAMAHNSLMAVGGKVTVQAASNVHAVIADICAAQWTIHIRHAGIGDLDVAILTLGLGGDDSVVDATLAGKSTSILTINISHACIGNSHKAILAHRLVHSHSRQLWLLTTITAVGSRQFSGWGNWGNGHLV
jgi:hypothetical protein